MILLFYYFRINGLVECFVRSFKVVMKKYSKIIFKEIDIFFMIYRVILYVIIGEIFVKLFMG